METQKGKIIKIELKITRFPYVKSNKFIFKRGLSKSTVTQMNLIAVQVPWVIVMLVLTCMGVRSSSLFVFPVMSSALANIVIHLTPLYKTGKSQRTSICIYTNTYFNEITFSQ